MALAAGCFVLFKTLAPTAKANASIRSFDLAAAPVGEVTYLEGGSFTTVVIRPDESAMVIFSVGVSENSTINRYRVWPGDKRGDTVWCDEFELEDDAILCLSQHRETLRWNLDGTPKDKTLTWQPDLPILPFEVQHGSVRYGRGV